MATLPEFEDNVRKTPRRKAGEPPKIGELQNLCHAANVNISVNSRSMAVAERTFNLGWDQVNVQPFA